MRYMRKTPECGQMFLELDDIPQAREITLNTLMGFVYFVHIFCIYCVQLLFFFFAFFYSFIIYSGAGTS